MPQRTVRSLSEKFYKEKGPAFIWEAQGKESDSILITPKNKNRSKKSL